MCSVAADGANPKVLLHAIGWGKSLGVMFGGSGGGGIRLIGKTSFSPHTTTSQSLYKS